MTRRGFFDPHVERYLIADEGEVVIDEVAKHWAAIVLPVLELLLALPVLLLIFLMPSQLYWLPIVGALWLAFRGIWRILQAQMDRFVITNMRVFRVHGILAQHIATMPITRILDISVKRPVVGRIFGFGHFIFESAAQDQGLREIKFVGNPNERGLTIQRVIQRSGLRGGMRSAGRDYVNADSGRGDGSPFNTGRTDSDRTDTGRTDTAPISTVHAESTPVDTSAWAVSADNPAWDPKSGDTQPLG
ncbi:PH domain-containing protein [Agromyces humatus]|uniref:YdbS-like PH domain-containing protein n=1 Tax=Agromyces humatus TaxID=279573 RepID=A0ABP4XB53_9MICO|nr:PH domain-containing protein [Agromyces humatus]